MHSMQRLLAQMMIGKKHKIGLCLFLSNFNLFMLYMPIFLVGRDDL